MKAFHQSYESIGTSSTSLSTPPDGDYVCNYRSPSRRGQGNVVSSRLEARRDKLLRLRRLSVERRKHESREEGRGDRGGERSKPSIAVSRSRQSSRREGGVRRERREVGRRERSRTISDIDRFHIISSRDERSPVKRGERIRSASANRFERRNRQGESFRSRRDHDRELHEFKRTASAPPRRRTSSPPRHCESRLAVSSRERPSLHSRPSSRKEYSCRERAISGPTSRHYRGRRHHHDHIDRRERSRSSSSHKRDHSSRERSSSSHKREHRQSNRLSSREAKKKQILKWSSEFNAERSKREEARRAKAAAGRYDRSRSREEHDRSRSREKDEEKRHHRSHLTDDHNDIHTRSHSGKAYKSRHFRNISPSNKPAKPLLALPPSTTKTNNRKTNKSIEAKVHELSKDDLLALTTYQSKSSLSSHHQTKNIMTSFERTNSNKSNRSKTEREALRQANVSLLSSQMSELDLESDNLGKEVLLLKDKESSDDDSIRIGDDDSINLDDSAKTKNPIIKQRSYSPRPKNAVSRRKGLKKPSRTCAARTRDEESDDSSNILPRRGSPSRLVKRVDSKRRSSSLEAKQRKDNVSFLKKHSKSAHHLDESLLGFDASTKHHSKSEPHLHPGPSEETHQDSFIETREVDVHKSSKSSNSKRGAKLLEKLKSLKVEKRFDTSSKSLHRSDSEGHETTAIVERRRSVSMDGLRNDKALVLRRDSSTVGLGSMADDYSQSGTHESPQQQQTTFHDSRASFNESIDVIRDLDTSGSMGIGSMALGGMDGDDENSTYNSRYQVSFNESIDVRTFNESIDAIQPRRDSVIDCQVVASDRAMQMQRISSLNDESCCNDSVDTSVPDTVFDIDKISFRSATNYLATRKKKHNVKQIDSSESCSLYPSVVSSQATEEDNISERKIDEIMLKIQQCREKSSQYTTKPGKEQQTKSANVVVINKSNSTSASELKKLPQRKVPPPPPRRMTHAQEETIQELPMKLPAPRTPAISRQPPTAPYRKHASTGAIPETLHKQRNKDPMQLIMSQLEHLEETSAHEGHQHSLSNNLHSSYNPISRRHTTGILKRNANQNNIDDQNDTVIDMPYSTGRGEHGLYSGEVDKWGRPHGEGRIDYQDDTCFDGRWMNGEPFHEPTQQQGVLNQNVHGGVVLSNPYNMSINGFNNSMGLDIR